MRSAKQEGISRGHSLQVVAGRGLEPVSNEAICTENFDWDFQSKFDSDTGT